MKRFSEQFNIKAQAIKLKTAERRDLRERLVAYMEYHPRPSTVAKVSPSAVPFNEPFRVVSFNVFGLLRWSAAAVLVLGIGTSYVAENTVPGDALYAVKVNFNEEVLSSLAMSPYEKVTWETERLNRRIAEARLLASEGKLTGAAEEDVVKAVREHSESARREIEELKLTDSQEATLASIQLSSALDVQSVALQMTENARSSEARPGAALLASVLEESKKSNDLEPVQELPSYDRLLARLEADTTRARELLDSVSSVVTAEEKHDVTRRLEDVERAMATAMSGASENDQSSRKVLFDAIHNAQKLIVFMANIDVRTALNVESVVPVVPTNEERQSDIQLALKEIARVQAVIQERDRTAVIEMAALDQADQAKHRVAELTAQANIALEAGDLIAADATSREALALGREALTLLGLTLPDEGVITEPLPATTTPTSTTPSGMVEGISATGTASTTATTTTN